MFYQSNKLLDIKGEMVARLVHLYPRREAENMVNRLILHLFGMSRVMQQIQVDKRLSESEMLIVHKTIQRLLKGEPIQYVLGVTEFYGLKLAIRPGALIPRPETEELVDMIVKEHRGEEIAVLDIGTGSGCIALALKNSLPRCHVMAVDVSEQALQLARENARQLHLDIDFKLCDILDTETCHAVLDRKFQLIVSNPPYVLQKEKVQMSGNVLNFEPHLALFVADDEPLLFYRKIIKLAGESLMAGGSLYFEINENYAVKTAALFDQRVFEKPLILKDIHGKERFVKARKHFSTAHFPLLEPEQ